jgi:hypothetical protein
VHWLEADVAAIISAGAVAEETLTTVRLLSPIKPEAAGVAATWAPATAKELAMSIVPVAIESNFLKVLEYIMFLFSYGFIFLWHSDFCAMPARPLRNQHMV